MKIKEIQEPKMIIPKIGEVYHGVPGVPGVHRKIYIRDVYRNGLGEIFVRVNSAPYPSGWFEKMKLGDDEIVTVKGFNSSIRLPLE